MQTLNRFQRVNLYTAKGFSGFPWATNIPAIPVMVTVKCNVMREMYKQFCLNSKWERKRSLADDWQRLQAPLGYSFALLWCTQIYFCLFKLLPRFTPVRTSSHTWKSQAEFWGILCISVYISDVFRWLSKILSIDFKPN